MTVDVRARTKELFEWAKKDRADVHTMQLDLLSRICAQNERIIELLGGAPTNPPLREHGNE